MDGADRALPRRRLHSPLTRAIRASSEPLANGQCSMEEHYPLQRARVPPRSSEIAEDHTAARRLPQTFEHPRRPDPTDRDLDHHREACPEREPRGKPWRPRGATGPGSRWPAAHPHGANLIALASPLNDRQLGPPESFLRNIDNSVVRTDQRITATQRQNVALHFRTERHTAFAQASHRRRRLKMCSKTASRGNLGTM
jgi:hypothetical protein